MRTKPIPHAYRAFFRQIGLDPDVDRIPSEEVAVTRLMQGGFRSVGLIDDACLVALVETGVPVWALDADRVDAGGLGIRTTSDADRSAAGSSPSRARSRSRTRARSTRCCSASRCATTGSARARDGSRCSRWASTGVPAIHVEEALWICADS